MLRVCAQVLYYYFSRLFKYFKILITIENEFIDRAIIPERVVRAYCTMIHMYLFEEYKWMFADKLHKNTSVHASTFSHVVFASEHLIQVFDAWCGSKAFLATNREEDLVGTEFHDDWKFFQSYAAHIDKLVGGDIAGHSWHRLLEFFHHDRLKHCT